MIFLTIRFSFSPFFSLVFLNFCSKCLLQIEYLIHKIRRTEEAFGSLQLIVTGDFFQLPQVPNHLDGDDGSICFLSDA